ncbi:hypothetical protein LTR84_011224 [Exophiala bonariae]|uniref:Uncharacterized protein n=1 Tax=Exophiala bonariae TaxID=1690606 RepID=A0AAV9NIK6_9EURO|nr:hypothetical protein LTR84_011224 [Exophiala bonariae]
MIVSVKGKRLALLKNAGNDPRQHPTNVAQVNAHSLHLQTRPSQKESIPFNSEATAAASEVDATTSVRILPQLATPTTSTNTCEVSSLTTVPMPMYPQSSPASQSPASSVSVSTSAEDCMMSHSNNTVFTALFKNGRVLGIPCGTQMLWKLSMRGPDVPATLQPTMLQRTVMHTSWIDRFPFPRMRDNFIKLNGIIDEEDFLACLFDTQSFTIVPGTMSWDPDGWIIGKDFREKWGFLFY